MRFLSKSLLFLLAAALVGTAYAHGPSRLKVTEKMTINASPADVWAQIKEFHAAHRWLPMVTDTAGDGGNVKGATRVLTLQGGGEVTEVLKRYSDEKMSYAYKIPTITHDVKLLPVTNYASTLSVGPAPGGGATVTWKGAFYRGFPNYDPPEEQNDDAAIAAVTGLYQAGLENLKTLVEAD